MTPSKEFLFLRCQLMTCPEHGHAELRMGRRGAFRHTLRAGRCPRLNAREARGLLNDRIKHRSARLWKAKLGCRPSESEPNFFQNVRGAPASAHRGSRTSRVTSGARCPTVVGPNRLSEASNRENRNGQLHRPYAA